MTSIKVAGGGLTLFNIFHTGGPQDQDKLFDQWRSLGPANVQPGLIAGNFHRGLDGRSVVNYAQWQSRADYQAFRAEAATRGRLGQALSFSSMDSIACEVVQTSDPAPELSVEKSWFTVVIVVEAPPHRQDDVLAEMTAPDPRLEQTPGYVAHAVHRDVTGECTVKYAQWADQESFEAFMTLPQEPSPIASFATARLYLTHLEYVRGRS